MFGCSKVSWSTVSALCNVMQLLPVQDERLKDYGVQNFVDG